jgi:hypothetical protein
MAVATNTRAVKRDATTAYVALNYTDGVRIYKTTNCGISWSLVSIQTSIIDMVTAIGVMPNTDILFLSTCSGNTWKIYKSIDGGVNFTLTGSRTVDTSSGRAKSTFCVLGNGVILTIIPVRDGTATRHVYICRSTDQGSSWNYNTRTSAYYPVNVMDNIEVASGVVLAMDTYISDLSTNYIFMERSTDYGASWLWAGQVLAPGGSYTSCTQLSNGKVFWAVSSDQNLRYSTNLGANWSSKSIPLNIVRLASTKNRLIASTTDNKIYISDNEGDSWLQVATTSSPIIDFILF